MNFASWHQYRQATHISQIAGKLRWAAIEKDIDDLWHDGRRNNSCTGVIDCRTRRLVHR